MNKRLFIASTLASLIFRTWALSAQNLPEVAYWIGSGSDTTFVVIDFKDGTPDSSYIWGYLYDGAKTGEDALNDLWAADANFNVNVDTGSFGNFLQDLSYHRHSGLGGQPDYWGTWDGPSLDSLTANNGIATPLVSGGIFGCSYMDFNPSVAPGTPWAAFKPDTFGLGHVAHWYGSGSDSTVLIIDFLNGTDTASFAWGFLMNDSISTIALLDSLTRYVPQLSATTSGGVSLISYKNLSGQIGATADWYSWTATNFGNWEPHYATPVFLENREMAAYTFNQFLELERPNVPANAGQNIGLTESTPLRTGLQLYPNPATRLLHIEGHFKEAVLYNMGGQPVLETRKPILKVSALKPGTYLLVISLPDGSSTQQNIVVTH